MHCEELDATSIDASKENGMIEVVRIPKLFYVKKNGPHAHVYSIDDISECSVKKSLKNRPRIIPISIFNANFLLINSNNKDDNFAYRFPSISHAIKMNNDFFVKKIDSQIINQGNSGDYLVTNPSGINEIIEKSTFNKEFVSIEMFNRIINRISSKAKEINIKYEYPSIQS